MVAERQELNGIIPEPQPLSNEVGDGNIMCEVGEQQAARVEVQGPKRRAVIPCCEKSFRFNQIAEMVTEGGEAHTISLCKLCYNETPVRQGKQPLEVAEWKEIVERKTHRGRLWKNLEVNTPCAECGNTSPSEERGQGTGGFRKREARRNTRSVATGVSLTKNFWNQSKGIRIRIAVPTRCTALMKR